MTLELFEKIALVFLGALISWLIQQYRAARSEESALLSEHIKDIEKLAEALADYWLKKPTTPDEEMSAAAKVRARHAATSLLYSQMLQICGKKAGSYKSLHLSLFKVGLGGNFEADARGCEPETALECYALSAQLVHLLRIVKVDLASFSRICQKCKTGAGKMLGTLPHNAD